MYTKLYFAFKSWCNLPKVHPQHTDGNNKVMM